MGTWADELPYLLSMACLSGNPGSWEGDRKSLYTRGWNYPKVRITPPAEMLIGLSYGSPGDTSDKEPDNADVRDTGSIPRWGRAPEGGNGNPLHYSCLKNPIDRTRGCKESDTTGETWQKAHTAIWGLPRVASGKASTCQCRGRRSCGFSLWAGKIPWRRAWQPIQYSCLGNSMDRGAWWATVYGITKIRTQLSDWTHAHGRPKNLWVTLWKTLY